MTRAEWDRLQRPTLRDRALGWAVSLLWTSAFMFGVFAPYYWVRA